jgi:hypothetical protein
LPLDQTSSPDNPLKQQPGQSLTVRQGEKQREIGLFANKILIQDLK